MKATFIPALVVGFAVALLLGSCSEKSSETRAATSKSSDQTGSESAGAKAAEVAEVQETGDAGESAGNPVVAEAYAKVMTEVRRIEQTATTQEKMFEAVEKIDATYNDFIEKYPDSEEANDARFQLGIMYASIGHSDVSAQYLNAYLDGVGNSTDTKVGYAHFYLAQAYEGADKFDAAEKHYKAVMEQQAQLDQRVVQAAIAALADLDTKRKLTIGGDPIPFKAKDLKGNELTLEKYKGKVVLLDFWATWCGPCRAEMPNVVATYKKFKDKGFEIIGISLDRDRDALNSYITSNGMEWPQYFDGLYWNNVIAVKYKVRSIPSTYLIDKDGKIRYRSIRGKALEEAVAKLLAET